MKMSFKRILLIVSASIVVLVSAVSAFAAGAITGKPVVTVGSQSLSDSDVLQLLASQTGGNMMMVGMALQQASLQDRKELVEQMGDALLLAEAAKAQNMQLDPQTALQIKWQTAQTLIQAYLTKVSPKWDTGEKAVKKYYEEHKADFVQKPASRVREVLSENREDSRKALLDIYNTKDFEKVAKERSINPGTGQKGGEVGWVEHGQLGDAVDKELDNAKKGDFIGPVKTPQGWLILEVEETRAEKQLSYEEASEQAMQGLQKQYLDAEVAALKKKINFTIDDNALGNLGGIPAPAEAPAKK